MNYKIKANNHYTSPYWIPQFNIVDNWRSILGSDDYMKKSLSWKWIDRITINSKLLSVMYDKEKSPERSQKE